LELTQETADIEFPPFSDQVSTSRRSSSARLQPLIDQPSEEFADRVSEHKSRHSAAMENPTLLSGASPQGEAK
jgi:hypothetical protein